MLSTDIYLKTQLRTQKVNKDNAFSGVIKLFVI